MQIQLTIELIESCKSTPWDFGNGVLYKLCQENFLHDNDEKIVGKVWLIGRAYAAAIERRKINLDIINDDFYIDGVVPAIKNSDLDQRLKELRKYDKLTESNLIQILETHQYLKELLKELTGLEKRSFCSKYLHFHLPNLFFIYDSRVVDSLRGFIKRTPRKFNSILKLSGIDNEYAKYVCKSLSLREVIEEEFGIEMTIRHLDNLLITFANNMIYNKQY